MFKGVIDNWINDFRTNPLLFWLELIGILGAMGGAGMLALTVPDVPFFLVYTSYIIGSTCLIIASYLRKNGFWIILNMFFVTIDIVGIFHLLVGKYHMIEVIKAFLR